MKNFLNKISFFELSKIIDRYLSATQNNNLSELKLLEKKYPDLFSKDGHNYLKDWLEVFGITSDILNKLHYNECNVNKLIIDINKKNIIH